MNGSRIRISQVGYSNAINFSIKGAEQYGLVRIGRPRHARSQNMDPSNKNTRAALERVSVFQISNMFKKYVITCVYHLTIYLADIGARSVFFCAAQS